MVAVVRGLQILSLILFGTLSHKAIITVQASNVEQDVIVWNEEDQTGECHLWFCLTIVWRLILVEGPLASLLNATISGSPK